MDVEAQDDGVMAKIIVCTLFIHSQLSTLTVSQQPDGSKSIQVGSRIAVLADRGDDVLSLEISPEDAAPTSSQPKQESQPPPPQPKSEAAPASKPDAQLSISQSPQNYPLYPSVQFLVHQHHLSVDQIPATGPKGRLLKGDVLAYLQQIPSTYPAELSARLTKRSHLDLSNIKPRAAPTKPPAKEAEPAAAEPAPVPISITANIDLTSVLRLQKKTQDTLGVALPLSTFIARAVELANEDLPASTRPLTAAELFDAVLGLDKVRAAGGRRRSRGHFVPQIVALPQVGLVWGMPAKGKAGGGSRDELFEEIVAPKQKKRDPGVRRVGLNGAVGKGAENIFALSVEKEDERRARVFLERMKSVLEVDPGRLVL